MQVVGVKNDVTFRVDQQKAQSSIIINSVIQSYARGFTHRGPMGYRSHCRRRPGNTIVCRLLAITSFYRGAP